MSYSLRQNPANAENYTVGRDGHSIKKIIIHHAATTDFDGIARTFQNPARGASAHYGVGQNGNVDQYVAESNTAWAAGNWPVNLESVNIENVNLSGAPDWLVDETTFNTLVDLVHNIAERNGLLPLKVRVNLFGHKDVSQLGTACPVTLEAKLQELADRVNGAANSPAPTPAPASRADQIIEVGSKIKFEQIYRVDNMAKINGIWQIQTNALCPLGFTWNDNGIPVDPLVEVKGGVGSVDQVLQVGSFYTIPGTYKVLELGQYQGHWLAKIAMAGWNLWVDVATVTEL